MYYLFLSRGKALEEYKKQFMLTKENISAGRTPVYSEVRCAKSNLIESVPYNTIHAVFLIAATLLMARIEVSDTIKIGLVLIVNSLTGAITNYIFASLKNLLRRRLCKLMNIEPSEEHMAVFESLEYQTV